MYDIDPDVLTICQRRISTAKCILVDKDDTTLPCETESLGLLLCIEVIEALRNDWFITEAFRVLRRSGLAVGVFKNRPSLRGYFRHLVSSVRGGFDFYELAYPGWRSRFCRQGFKMIYEEGICWFPSGSYTECGAMPDQRVKQLLTVPSDERWAAFVHSMPDANIFHHPAWIGLMAECYGYRPFVVAVCDENGEIQAGLPLMEVHSPLTGRRWVSLPFTDHCAPLSHDDVPPQGLFEYLSALQIEHGVPRVELRSAVPYDGLGYRDNSQVLHLLRLSTDAQKVFNTFHRSQVKRSIAKAEREGVTVRRAEDGCDLDIFYDLHLKTRHRLGVPIQPKRYFELLWRHIVDAGLGFILLAYKDSRPVAGGVFLTYKNALIYKYGASDRDYRRFRANHLLFWTSIRWGCEHGYKLFDWGKTSIDNTGLRNFKNGWGTQESVLTYSVLSATPPNHITDRLSGIMETFICHMPKWVCRATGELLYRHFA